MKILITLLSLSTLLFSALSAIQIENKTYCAVGYRTDNLSWDVTHLPFENLLTTQDWKDIRFAQFSAGLESTFCNKFYLQLDADFAWVAHGHKHYDQVDLNGWIVFDEPGWFVATTEGYAYDLSGGVGYSFSLFCDKLTARPLFGYSYNVQHFKDEDYKDIVYVINFFRATSSRYTYRWKGPWIGFNLETTWDNGLTTFLQYQHHFSSYKGRNKDGIFDQYIDHQRKKSINGNELTLAISYPWRGWQVGILGNYKYFKGKNGQNKLAGHMMTLNHISWRSLNFNLGISRCF